MTAFECIAIAVGVCVLAYILLVIALMIGSGEL